MLSEREVARRKPVWSALSALWLDTELADRRLSEIAGVMHDSGYSIDELRHIYLYEVAPAVFGNLLTAAGEWAGFDEAPPERLYPTGDGAAEFQRTVSRLQEMRSKEYIALEHAD